MSTFDLAVARTAQRDHHVAKARVFLDRARQFRLAGDASEARRFAAMAGDHRVCAALFS